MTHLKGAFRNLKKIHKKVYKLNKQIDEIFEKYHNASFEEKRVRTVQDIQQSWEAIRRIRAKLRRKIIVKTFMEHLLLKNSNLTG